MTGESIGERFMGRISMRLMEYLARRKAEPAPAEGRKLTRDQQIIEDARAVAGGEKDTTIVRLYEELSPRLYYERAVELKCECCVCGFQWEPGGLSDPLAIPLKADGSLSAHADDLKSRGISVPRSLLFMCPKCLEDDRLNPGSYACSHGQCSAGCKICT
jgi:hypothetical protein